MDDLLFYVWSNVQLLAIELRSLKTFDIFHRFCTI